MKTRFSILVAGCWAISGCASIMSSSRRTVTFTSEPTGATVCVRDTRTGNVVQSGQTPFKVPLSSSAGYFDPARYEVEYSKPGHIGSTSELQARMSLWYPGNLLFGCLPGLLLVDPLTGAMWRLDRRHHANLASDPPDPDRSSPLVESQPPPEESQKAGE